MTLLLLSPLAFSAGLAPGQAWACACGCGIFDAGPTSLMPTMSDSGYSVWFRYSYMNQDHNWEGSAKAPNSDNGDKHIETNFYTIGGEDMINRDWTVMAELPVFNRQLTTTDANGNIAGPAGTVYNAKLTALGDAKIMGVYTGISPDMSNGLSFGVKLPTGNYAGPTGPLGGPQFDPDSLPGTGSADLMFGGYHVGELNSDGSLSYFVQATYQFAVVTLDQYYRPGNEIDGSAGLIYNFGAFGRISKVAPVLSLLTSIRNHDNGANSDPLNSGYQRLLIAPGIEMAIDKVNLYADIEIPIYQYTNSAQNIGLEGTSGQLVAPFAVKVQLGYSF